MRVKAARRPALSPRTTCISTMKLFLSVTARENAPRQPKNVATIAKLITENHSKVETMRTVLNILELLGWRICCTTWAGCWRLWSVLRLILPTATMILRSLQNCLLKSSAMKLFMSMESRKPAGKTKAAGILAYGTNIFWPISLAVGYAPINTG